MVFGCFRACGGGRNGTHRHVETPHYAHIKLIEAANLAIMVRTATLAWAAAKTNAVCDCPTNHSHRYIRMHTPFTSSRTSLLAT
jgi:hypothetical protein